jgi:uncharacterized protein (UPF0548 family)
MFFLRKPAAETIARFLASQHDLPWSYREVGATQNETFVSGYSVDHNRIRLGEGEHTYQRALAALRSWKQFELGWVTLVPPHAPVIAGTTVAVLVQSFGFWSLSAARIVYVVSESTPAKRFGFAYGTLPNHVECGEERFSVEWLADNSVWYDIFAFSRPQHLAVKLGFPLARRLQQQFAKDSLAAMKTAANSS